MKRNYLELIDKKHDELVEMYIKEKKTLADHADGMHTELRLWEDGTVDTSGLLGTNSWTVGDFLTVAHVSTWDSLEGFNLSEQAQNHDRYQEVKQAYTEAEQDDNYLGADFCNFLEAEFPGVVEELQAAYKEWALDEVEDYGRDEAIVRIEATKAMLM